MPPDSFVKGTTPGVLSWSVTEMIECSSSAETADLVNEGIVQFPGPGLEVLQHVRNAHAGVLMTNPSHGQEGLSNSLMEYMACGLPVVCSAGGGNREVVIDETTGFVIAPFDAEGLAKRLAWLREHEFERGAMGDAGRRRIRDVFSIAAWWRITSACTRTRLRLLDAVLASTAWTAEVHVYVPAPKSRWF